MIERLQQEIELELREDERLGKMLHAVILAEGRAAAGGRSELFTPGSVTWPEEGIEIKIGHSGAVEALGPILSGPRKGERSGSRFERPKGLLRLSEKGSGGCLSNFFALAENRVPAGIREITSALIQGAALVASPEYSQGRAEVRSQQRRRLWL